MPIKGCAAAGAWAGVLLVLATIERARRIDAYPHSDD